MKRRTFLSGATGVIGALTGCTGDDSDAADTTTRNTSKSDQAHRPVYRTAGSSAEATTTEGDPSQTTHREGYCTGYNSNDDEYTYRCHNNDEGIGFDSYYVEAVPTNVSAVTAGPSGGPRIVEIDFSKTVDVYYQTYQEGTYPTWDYGIRGYLTTNTYRTYNIKITIMFFTLTENSESIVPFGSAEDTLNGVRPGVSYPFDVGKYIRFSRPYVRFKLWIHEPY